MTFVTGLITNLEARKSNMGTEIYVQSTEVALWQRHYGIWIVQGEQTIIINGRCSLLLNDIYDNIPKPLYGLLITMETQPSKPSSEQKECYNLSVN